MKAHEFSSASPDATFALGRALGGVLEERDYVGLNGQLGAGKTLFSRGVADGAGVPLEDVSSPTYSIVQSYSGRLRLHHADLYRLTSENDLYATGYFDLLEGEGAFLVEWVGQVRGAAPEDWLQVDLAVTGPDARRVSVVAHGDRSEQLLSRWVSASAAP